MNAKLLSLDLATRLTGYAIFEAVEDGNALTQYGLIKAKQKEEFDIRTIEIQQKVWSITTKEKCTHLVIEYPEFQSGTRGNTAVRKGDTLKLAYVCGAVTAMWVVYKSNMEQATEGKIDIPLAELITPTQWKGQCPKQVTAMRCNKKYGVNATKERGFNYTDAIMLGDFWLHMNQLKVSEVLRSRRVDY